MSPFAWALVAIGVVLVVIGVWRGYRPYQRYSALKAQDANIARYEAWRGGVRGESKTGASVAMDILRRQMQVSGVIVIAGVACVVLGFVIG